MQSVLRVLEFTSRFLSKSERNLCAYRRETLGLIFALRKFRSYLLGREFRVRVDNMALKSLLTVKDRTGQLARHFLADYNFSLEHRPGKAHQNCDSLSRLRPCHDGPGGEPCKHCIKLVTGEHINVVVTRRQARLKPLLAPTLLDAQQTSSDVACAENDDELSADDDDDANNVADDCVFSPLIDGVQPIMDVEQAHTAKPPTVYWAIQPLMLQLMWRSGTLKNYVRNSYKTPI